MRESVDLHLLQHLVLSDFLIFSRGVGMITHCGLDLIMIHLSDRFMFVTYLYVVDMSMVFTHVFFSAAFSTDLNMLFFYICSWYIYVVSSQIFSPSL